MIQSETFSFSCKVLSEYSQGKSLQLSTEHWQSVLKTGWYWRGLGDKLPDSYGKDQARCEGDWGQQLSNRSTSFSLNTLLQLDLLSEHQALLFLLSLPDSRGPLLLTDTCQLVAFYRKVWQDVLILMTITLYRSCTWGNMSRRISTTASTPLAGACWSTWRRGTVDCGEIWNYSTNLTDSARCEKFVCPTPNLVKISKTHLFATKGFSPCWR